jgi:hypothetical protein
VIFPRVCLLFHPLFCRKAGRGKRDTQCNSETKENGFEKYYVASGVRSEKDHVAPEVKMVNEIVCDQV